MNSDKLKLVEQQMDALEQLRKLLSMPGGQGVLDALYSIPIATPSAATARPKPGFKPSPKGSLLANIETVARALQKPFTVAEMISAYEAHGHVFEAHDKNVAVYAALKRLKKRGLVEVHKQGVGNKPSTYVWVG